MWVRVRDAIAGALDSMTLADLVPPLARLNPTGLPVLGAQTGLAAKSGLAATHSANPLTLAD